MHTFQDSGSRPWFVHIGLDDAVGIWQATGVDLVRALAEPGQPGIHALLADEYRLLDVIHAAAVDLSDRTCHVDAHGFGCAVRGRWSSEDRTPGAKSAFLAALLDFEKTVKQLVAAGLTPTCEALREALQDYDDRQPPVVGEVSRQLAATYRELAARDAALEATAGHYR